MVSTPPSQIISRFDRFGFSIYIIFTMNLDVVKN